jgi:hypothetical protein
MIGDSLNCRGVCKKDMSAFLQDLIKNQMLDFVALQETVKKYYSHSFFKRINPFDQFRWKWSPSVRVVGQEASLEDLKCPDLIFVIPLLVDFT